MSRFYVAGYLETSPESVARAFAVLEQQGFVRRLSPQTIEYVDADGLARFVRTEIQH
jgi:DNA-binding transcriptional regulator YhcF (GntR family)